MLNTARSIAGLNQNLAYDYDTLNRLTAATRPLAGDASETFSYDEIGNRLQREGDTQDSLFDQANRLLEDSIFTYAYDNNGNLIQKTEKGTSQTTIYTYDAENQLIQIDFANGNIAQYRYDGLGRRISKTFTLNASLFMLHYVYDGEDILLEFDSSNTLKTRYTHGAGIDEPLIMERFSVIPAEAGIYFYLTDGLGSITELTDSNGTITQSYVYDSFGNLNVFDSTGSLIPHSSLLSPYTYTGREYDSESGLYYYRARYYDSSVGRFMSEDPVLSTNLYSYTDNNPINRTDPLGLYWGEDQVDWWAYESVVPGPYGQPMSEWQGGSSNWGDPMKYTEAVGGGWMWAERAAIGVTIGATFCAIGAGIGVIPNYSFKFGIHPAEHYFPEYGEKLRHLQINKWLQGVKGSGKVWRYPFK